MSVIFKRKEIPYNVKAVNRLVLIIQKTTNKALTDKSKLELFNYLTKAVDKNVNNYLLLARNSGMGEGYEVDELVIELFLIMNKCIEKYVVNKKNNFYFYFNKSASRTLFSLYEKELKKSADTIRLDGDRLNYKTEIQHSVDTMLLDFLDLTENEKLICMSKINEQRREDFLLENLEITNNAYHLCMKSIKTKLKKLKEQNEL